MNISPIRNSIYFKRSHNVFHSDNRAINNSEIDNLRRIAELKQKIEEIADYREAKIIELFRRKTRIEQQAQLEIGRIEREKAELMSTTSKQIYDLSNEILELRRKIQ